jgi:hypothetical protein
MATSPKRNAWQIRVAHPSSWENHEELHFMQDEPPPHFSLPFLDCLVNHFTDWASEYKQNGLREVPILHDVISFCGGNPKRKRSGPKTFDEPERQIRQTLLLFLLPSYKRMLGVRLPGSTE